MSGSGTLSKTELSVSKNYHFSGRGRPVTAEVRRENLLSYLLVRRARERKYSLFDSNLYNPSQGLRYHAYLAVNLIEATHKEEIR